MRFWLITELGSTFIRPQFVGTQQLLRLKKQWWIFGRFSSIIPLICHHLVQSKCKLSFEQKLLYKLKSQRKVLSLRRCLFRQPKIAQNYIYFFPSPSKIDILILLQCCFCKIVLQNLSPPSENQFKTHS